MVDGDGVGQILVDSARSREQERWGGLPEYDAWGALESASNGEHSTCWVPPRASPSLIPSSSTNEVTYIPLEKEWVW